MSFIDLAKNLLGTAKSQAHLFSSARLSSSPSTLHLIQYIMKVHAACRSHHGSLGIEYSYSSSTVKEASRVITCLTFQRFEGTVSNRHFSIMSKWHLLSFTLLGSCINAFSWPEFGHWDQVERPVRTRERLRDLNSGLTNKAQSERQSSNIKRLILE